MEVPSRNAAYLPTVKCSSCAADIELTAVAEHICSPSISYNTVEEFHHSHAVPAADYYPAFDPSTCPPDQGQQERYQATSPARSHRPVLPKLDSTVTGRSGLRPSEAASIAHDLGLPSPLSARGTGHRAKPRSRSRSRKASGTRPPSPDVPLSQDCAFPPFPMKPKRSQTDKEVHKHNPQSTSRSTTSTKESHHAPSYSTSSSVYSAGSGPGKRWTSNTNSSQRSRQGTVDGNIPLPSILSTNMQQLEAPLFNQNQSIDHNQQVPSLISSASTIASEPTSSASMMPPTPSWPSSHRDAGPRIVQSPMSETGWTPTENTIAEEHTYAMANPIGAVKDSNKIQPFDQISRNSSQAEGINSYDNPPRESLYKTKRPTPLLQLPQYAGNDIGMPLSARPAPPQHSASNNSGLTRTLTNLFGRKRAQSSSSKNMPLPTFDSPRMRALAPEPPERPKRDDEGLWNTAELSTVSPDDQPSSSFHLPEVVPQVKDHTAPERQTDTTDSELQKHARNMSSMGGAIDFDFRFNQQKPTGQGNGSELSLPQVDQLNRSPAISEYTNTETVQSEEDLRRASIDSASSYGSIGFSHRTKSSASSHPASSEIKQKKSPMLDSGHLRINSTDLLPPPRPYGDEAFPDSPTDPLYQAGKLSPVPESEPLQQSPPAELYSPPPPPLPLYSPTSESSSLEGLKIARPVTPGGVKGKCRGCTELIMVGQKSISSADGRLSGKYHKECFVCRTCKGAFATADFYVFEDQPYCAHHYHVLNHTLCTGCGKGIEGQYFETFDIAGKSSKKFHSKCLQCATCKAQLNEDYFEFHGRVYCERDAFRAANGPRSPYDTVPSRPSPLVREYISSGDPGLKGRFPERRTTRLIMT